jgi:small subunit ribosomal protein S35
MFEDIPLDLRHHKVRRKLRFPDEWKLTDERRKMLVDLRAQQQQLDDGKRAEGLLIDGVNMIKEARGRLPAPERQAQRVAVPLRREIRMPETRQRTGLRKKGF